ncbi:hypothetical protein CsatA_028339 [Cannabis sativa]
MIVLSWNCRGLARPVAIQALKVWRRRYKVDCLFLIETKVGRDQMDKVRFELDFEFGIFIPALGLAGGFCLLWNKEANLKVARVRETSFECWVSDPSGGKDWTLFAIYGTPYKEQKDDFWEEVASYVKRCQSPWAVVGDLNVILEKDDKYGGRMVSYRDCEILSSFLEETGGIDLGFHGCKFTWRNKRDNGKLIRERIDRVLVDTDWLTLYPKAGVRNLPIVASDHGPILFDSLMCKRRGSGIFRFYEA